MTSGMCQGGVHPTHNLEETGAAPSPQSHSLRLFSGCLYDPRSQACLVLRAVFARAEQESGVWAPLSSQAAGRRSGWRLPGPLQSVCCWYLQSRYFGKHLQTFYIRGKIVHNSIMPEVNERQSLPF